MSLERRLRAQIALEGPITVADYMTACLHDPLDGYYATRPKLGADGDFVTAPLLSQMFGELIGAWIAEVWSRLGRPSPFRLVELGPGDGTLMTDALRALRRAFPLLDAAELWLVEPSAPLRALQAQRLEGAEARWVSALDDAPAGAPMILVANEVLDCLPARQFVRMSEGWAERRVGLDDAGALVFGLAPMAEQLELPHAAAPGAVVELSPAQAALGGEIGARIAAEGGAALVIDYGRDSPGFGDTLQALKGHRKADPLCEPGWADLTVHADFPAVAAIARRAGAATTAIIGQGAFLRALGIEVRAGVLARARPDRAEVIARQLHRLTAPDQMGTLFKALCIHQDGLVPPGFETP